MSPQPPPDHDASRWRLVEEIRATALQLTEPAREAYLADRCGSNDGLRREVEALLADERAADGFLSAPQGAAAVRALTEPGRDLVGSRLGDYEIVGKLGAGGMGVVYRARDHRLDRDVALKVVTRQGGADDFARLRSEARAAARLNHANICTVFEVAVADGVACIAMEWIDGTPLSASIATGWSTDKVCRTGRQIADALAHAHANGITHRDLKSSNIMIRRDGHVKVIDFGIADRAVRSIDQTETQRAVVPGMAGTLPYLAPELLNGAQPDARSDLWSLGVVLFEMTTGRLPFRGSGAPDLAAAILRDPPPSLPRTVTPGLARVIEQCLAKDPGDRPAGAAEVARALNIVNPGAEAREGRNRKWMWAAAVATLALIVIAYRWWPRDDTGGAVVRFENPTQVTTTTGVEEFAEWSPDGRMLAYSASTTGHLADDWDIWVIQPGSGAPINRTGGFGGRNMFPSWSPDGSRISFWSTVDGGGCYVMPALAGAPRRVSPARIAHPSPAQWSPDGGELSCVAGTGEKPMLSVVSLDTGQERRRIPLPGDGRRMFVTLSPDQKRIAMALGAVGSGLESDVTDLMVLDIDSGRLQPLTDGRSKAWSPSWSRDGRSLYYVAQAGTAMDLWEQPFAGDGTAVGAPRTITAGIGMRSAALSRDGRRLAYSIGRRVGNIYRVPFRQDKPATWAEAEQLTFDQASVQCLDLDRSGTRLAVSSDRSGSFDLWTMPAAGGSLMQLTSDPSVEWCPAWSPDGGSLAFFAYRSGNRDVWTMPSGGGEWKQITANEGSDLHPSWMFDGTAIAYQSQRNSAIEMWLSPINGGPVKQLGTFSSGRLSPIDRRLAGFRGDNNTITIVDLDERQPRFLVQARSINSGSWSSDGHYLIVRSAPDQISSVGTTPGATSRVVVDLSGRRGSLGIYNTPSDGRFIYFIWEENLGDIWTMTLASSSARP